MTELEYQVELARYDVRLQELKVQEAQEALQNGYDRLKATLEKKYEALKRDLTRASVNPLKEQLWLNYKQAELERGFSSSE